jgi:hypothetical protein
MTMTWIQRAALGSLQDADPTKMHRAIEKATPSEMRILMFTVIEEYRAIRDARDVNKLRAKVEALRDEIKKLRADCRDERSPSKRNDDRQPGRTGKFRSVGGRWVKVAS